MSKKGIISREEIVGTIYSILYYKDKNLQPKEKYEPFDFINKYINKINDKIYSDFLLDYAGAFNNIIAAKSIVDLIIKYKPETDFTVPFIYAAKHRYDEICNYMIDQKIYLNFQMIINCSLDFSKAS